jgi:ubiquinone/menaquinone biosynthesis C-methylase UbiE
METKEDCIRFENDLASELLNSDEKSRSEKYTEVYEKSYTYLTEEMRDQLSNDYLKAALTISKMVNKVIGEGKYVLDIGCGFGHLSYLIAQKGNLVTGIDINRIHVQEATQKYADTKNVSFRDTKGVKLEFPDNSFHFVVSTSVVEHLHPDDVDTHFSEVHRILKTGGKYIFTAVTPYIRSDIAAYSKDQEQQEKHGFHINEKTWNQFHQTLNEHYFMGKTDILPSRIVMHMPGFLFLVPLSLKSWLERNIKINDLNVRLFKLGHVFIVAQKC